MSNSIVSKNVRHILVLSICFFCICPISLADNWQPINVLSTNNGLPTNEVRQVFQDREGYIWIATVDGLCRYDGFQLKTYKTNLYTPGLLSSNNITVIAEDYNHNIWIGTKTGLNILSKITGEVKHVSPEKLLGFNIQSILVTKSNQVWIGTANGLNKYIAETDSFEHYDNSSTNYKLSGNDIKTIIEDAKGSIWIGTWSDGITRLDQSKNIFYPYPKINDRNSAHIIFEDNENNIWVGSWGSGLFRLENPYDPDKVKYINYRHDKNNPNSLSDNIVYAMSQDLKTNSIWIGTRSGLSILNLANKENPFAFINHLPNNAEQSIMYNDVNSIIRDNSNLMWLGTLGGGISIINTYNSLFSHNPLDNVKNVLFSSLARSIYVDDTGVVWLGVGSYGLVSYIPEKNQYTFYENHPDFRKTPITTSVHTIIKNQSSNSYWIGTDGEGIFIYNPTSKNEKVKNLRVDTHKWLSNDVVFYLKEDSNGMTWIGCRSGICVYDPKTDTGTAYPHLGQKNNNNKSREVYCIEEENPSTMWLGTSSDGVFKVKKDPLTSKILNFTHYETKNEKLNNNNIECLYYDSKERLWLGSKGGGLSLYDKEQDVFVCVHQKYNLPGDIISSIEEDHTGNLWLGTNAGLAMLGFSDEDVLISSRNYSIADGLQDNAFYRNAAFKTKDGILYFGGHNGYNYFDPSKRQEQYQKPPLVITDIKIYNNSLETLDNKLRHKISVNAPGYTQKIQLPYKYNNFTFEFAALTYSNFSQNKYTYKLSGFDQDWQYTDDSRRFATYNNLKSGKYTFYLKASNESGIWDEQEIVIEVVVLPPPWLTWWAYAIYFILAIILTCICIRIVKNKISLKNALKIENMEKLKQEELNHAKLQFFTNITHEFLTPLTIISASVDELKMQAPQNSDYYNVMSNNINRLIRLLQQILEFRKAETGNLKLRVSRGDVAAFIKSEVDSFKPLMLKKKLHFSFVCDPKSIVAYFDNDKLDKILFNLFSNASKYNKKGGFVHVDLSIDSKDNNYIIISVRDNGEGIKREEMKGLFKRFYEGDYRRFKTIGTGIGLSLTKDLVELHRGEITVESEVGMGSTFIVRLPINREAYSENEIDDSVSITNEIRLDEETKEEDATSNGKENRKEYSLLLVEDNDELLRLMKKLLGKQYNIYTAGNGKEGIEILKKEYIDLAISDIMMPVMDGIEFCKYVKSNFEISHVPVILLTAKNKEEDRVEAYNSGADGFISKPFNLNVLHSKIKNLLEARNRMIKKFKQQVVYEATEMDYTSIDEEFLNKAIACVHQHISDVNFDQTQFADAMGISKSTLYKKLKSLSGLNTTFFIRNIRLKTACKIIEEKKNIRISELAYSIGFNDPRYFGICFKKEFGVAPSEYLNRILDDEEQDELNKSKE